MTETPAATPATPAATPPAAPDSPAVKAAKEIYELRKLELDTQRLELEDRAKVAEAKNKLFTDAVTTAKAALPTTLDVSVEKDTLTPQNDVIGLDRVYASFASAASIDDIADHVIAVTNHVPSAEFLVLEEATIFDDAEVSRLLHTKVEILKKRVDAEIPAQPSTPGEVQVDALLAVPAVAAAIGSLLPSGISLLTKLFAHQYTTSGSRITDPALGLDLRLAGAVLAKSHADPTVAVHVGRLWTPPTSAIVESLVALATSLVELATLCDDAAGRERMTKAAVDQKVLAIADARARQLELSKTASKTELGGGEKPTEWQTVWQQAVDEIERHTADLPALSTEHTQAASRAREVAALKTDVEELLVAALTAPADGAAPIIRAIRGDWLRGGAQRMILYVKALSAGADRVDETKVGPDKRGILAGSSIEYGLVDHESRLVAAGVLDGLWGGANSLSQPQKFRGSPINYTPHRNQQRPAPQGLPSGG